MLIQRPDLGQRLEWHLRHARSVDIATAFVSDPGSKALRAVIDSRRDGTSVRVIVGSMDGSQDTERRRASMRQLASQGVIVREHSERFHAKAYIFRHADVTYGWFGSPNLTDSAFRGNDELVLETADKRDIRDLVAWFEDRWRASSIRKVNSWASEWEALVSGHDTLVGLSSGNRAVDCDCAEVHISASDASSIYWKTTMLVEEASGNEGRLDWVSVPRDAATSDPILGAVLLQIPRSTRNGGTARDLLQECQTSDRPLRLRIGAPCGGAHCNVSVEELSPRSRAQAGTCAATLAMRSPLVRDTRSP